MFRSFINDAKSAAGAVIGKYAIRASVALPFVIAAGFGTAAITLLLVDRFGAIMAYSLMAGGFAAVGLIAAVAVTVKEQEQEVVDEKAEKADTAEVASDAAAQAAVQLPIALLGTLLTSPLGPNVAASGAKALARNLPLVILLAVIAFLFWPSDGTEAQAEASDQSGNPESDPPAHAGEDEQPAAFQSPLQARNGVDRQPHP